MTQVRVRPPTFCIFVNNPEGVVEAYDRYLKNRLREEYGFGGTPCASSTGGAAASVKRVPT